MVVWMFDAEITAQLIDGKHFAFRREVERKEDKDQRE